MGKLLNYVMLIGGLMVLMNLAGITTLSGAILNWMGISITNIEDFSATPFMIVFGAAIASLVLVSGIRIGFFGANVSAVSVTAVAATPLLIFVGDIIMISTAASTGGLTWVSYIIFALTVPLVIGYGITLYDWVRGIE